VCPNSAATRDGIMNRRQPVGSERRGRRARVTTLNSGPHPAPCKAPMPPGTEARAGHAPRARRMDRRAGANATCLSARNLCMAEKPAVGVGGPGKGLCVREG
jgi:hypothetical protein